MGTFYVQELSLENLAICVVIWKKIRQAKNANTTHALCMIGN
jgi:hypothetical protein